MLLMIILWTHQLGEQQAKVVCSMKAEPGRGQEPMSELLGGRVSDQEQLEGVKLIQKRGLQKSPQVVLGRPALLPKPHRHSRNCNYSVCERSEWLQYSGRVLCDRNVPKLLKHNSKGNIDMPTY